MAQKEGDFESAWRYRVVERALGRRGAKVDDSAFSSSKAKPLLTSLLDTMDAVRSLAQDPLATGEVALQEVAQLQEYVAEQADPVPVDHGLVGRQRDGNPATLHGTCGQHVEQYLFVNPMGIGENVRLPGVVRYRSGFIQKHLAVSEDIPG